MIKSVNWLIVVVVLFFTCFSQITFAQSFSVGGGVPYNLSIESPGINLRGYYNVAETFCFGPEFIFFFPKKEIHDNKETEISIQEFNVNAHYIFELKKHIGIYPLVGLNYTLEREKITYLDKAETANDLIKSFGVNLGGGIHFPISNFVPFLEYEYVLGDLKEHIVTFGAFITLGKEEE